MDLARRSFPRGYAGSDRRRIYLGRPRDEYDGWVVDGVIEENHPYTLCASVNLPFEELEGVYASAQISIDEQSGSSLRADQRLEYDEATKLWTRTLKPGSRRLLIIDGRDIHVWAVSKGGSVSDPLRVPCEWRLQGY